MPVPEDIVAPTEPAASSGPAYTMRSAEAEEFGSGRRILAPTNLRFFLRHHARNWGPEKVKATVAGVKLDGVFWLPELGILPLQPGAAGIRTRGKDEAAEMTYQAAREKSVTQGWTWLDPLRALPAECLPPGVPPGPYLRGLDCMDPQSGQTGVHWIEVWKLPTATIEGEPQRFAFQRETYANFRAWLVLAGIVRPPLPHVLEVLAERMKGRIERAENLPISGDLLKRRVGAATEAHRPYVDAKIPGRPGAAASP